MSADKKPYKAGNWPKKGEKPVEPGWKKEVTDTGAFTTERLVPVPLPSSASEDQKRLFKNQFQAYIKGEPSDPHFERSLDGMEVEIKKHYSALKDVLCVFPAPEFPEHDREMLRLHHLINLAIGEGRRNDCVKLIKQRDEAQTSFSKWLKDHPRPVTRAADPIAGITDPIEREEINAALQLFHYIRCARELIADGATKDLPALALKIGEAWAIFKFRRDLKEEKFRKKRNSDKGPNSRRGTAQLPIYELVANEGKKRNWKWSEGDAWDYANELTKKQPERFKALAGKKSFCRRFRYIKSKARQHK
jgi:hypothetical protein